MRPLGYLRTVVRNRFGGDKRARFLTHTVTFKCNARCIMCDSWKIRSADDLSLQEIERIYGELPRMDVVRLTGGEPFVRKDFPEIVESAERLLDPMAMQITTNGFQSDSIVDLCERRRRDRPLFLLVSMDGLEKKHNEVRGRDTAWDQCLETVRRLGPRQEELRLRMAVNQTIVDGEGAAQVRALRRELEPFGVRNQVVMAYDVSATYSVERNLDVAPKEVGHFATFGDFEEQDVRKLLDELDEDVASYPIGERMAKRYYLEGLRERLLGEGVGPRPNCVALQNHIRVFPNGDVPVCQFNSRVVGSLRDQSFDEVWSGDGMDEHRSWVKSCAGCWAECEVLPSAIYTGDLLALRGKKLARSLGLGVRRPSSKEPGHSAS